MIKLGKFLHIPIQTSWSCLEFSDILNSSIKLLFGCDGDGGGNDFVLKM
jgi:hypothetical protein